MRKILFIYGMLLIIAGNAYSQIEGIVIDKNGTAIPNVMIISTDSTGKIIDTVKSDKRGGYAFKGLKPGKYIIEAKAPGFLSSVYKNMEVGIAQEGTDEGDDTYYAIRLDITLTRPKTPN